MAGIRTVANGRKRLSAEMENTAAGTDFIVQILGIAGNTDGTVSSHAHPHALLDEPERPATRTLLRVEA